MLACPQADWHACIAPCASSTQARKGVMPCKALSRDRYCAHASSTALWRVRCKHGSAINQQAATAWRDTVSCLQSSHRTMVWPRFQTCHALRGHDCCFLTICSGLCVQAIDELSLPRLQKLIMQGIKRHGPPAMHGLPKVRRANLPAQSMAGESVPQCEAHVTMPALQWLEDPEVPDVVSGASEEQFSVNGSPQVPPSPHLSHNDVSIYMYILSKSKW